jgi:hypothetical protein
MRVPKIYKDIKLADKIPMLKKHTINPCIYIKTMPDIATATKYNILLDFILLD